MKIKDLAAELNFADNDVLEKAKAMGIKVADVSDELSDIDVTAVKNTMMRSGKKAETTKVVRKAKKADAETEKKDDEPKVTVKAANIKMPEVKKTSKALKKQIIDLLLKQIILILFVKNSLLQTVQRHLRSSAEIQAVLIT